MNEPPDQSRPLRDAELLALYSVFILLFLSLSPPAAHSTPLLWIGRSNALEWEWAGLNPLDDCAQKKKKYIYKMTYTLTLTLQPTGNFMLFAWNDFISIILIS